MPCMFYAQPLLLLNNDGQKQFHDVCTTGILLGKAEVYFIILQRQHLKYAENCAEAQRGLHSPTPGLASHQHNS